MINFYFVFRIEKGNYFKLEFWIKTSECVTFFFSQIRITKFFFSEKNAKMIRNIFLIFIQFFHLCYGSPEVGVWDFFNLTQEANYVGMVKNVFSGSHLDIRVRCSTAGLFNVSIGYMLRRTLCWEEYLNLDTEQAKIERIYQTYYRNPGWVIGWKGKQAGAELCQTQLCLSQLPNNLWQSILLTDLPKKVAAVYLQ